MSKQSELDEIVLNIRKAESGIRDAHKTDNPRGVLEHHVEQIEKSKQALLDWQNKQIEDYKGIIKMSDTYTFDTGKVYYSKKAVNKQIEEVLDRLEKDFTKGIEKEEL